MSAGIAYNRCMQYTLRHVPTELDAAIRRRAREEGKSLNEVAIQAMARGMGYVEQPKRLRDLSDIVGRWHEDPEFDAAIADQDRIDEELWK